MKPAYVDAMCLACNSVWLWSSVFLYFLFPSMSLERWNTDGSANTFLCIVCSVLQSHFIRSLPLHSNTYHCFLLPSLPESPPHLLFLFFCFVFFLFSCPLQQIKKLKTTTLVSVTCLTWQQEALFPCMFSKWVKIRWVHERVQASKTDCVLCFLCICEARHECCLRVSRFEFIAEAVIFHLILQ